MEGKMQVLPEKEGNAYHPKCRYFHPSVKACPLGTTSRFNYQPTTIQLPSFVCSVGLNSTLGSELNLAYLTK